MFISKKDYFNICDRSEELKEEKDKYKEILNRIETILDVETYRKTPSVFIVDKIKEVIISDN